MSEWLAIHVHYHGDHDRLLTEALSPLLSLARSDGSIRDFFFVRYWNGGPHVRIRVRLPDRVAVSEVVPILAKPIETWLHLNPGNVADAAGYQRQAELMANFRNGFQGAWEIGREHLEDAEPFHPHDEVLVPVRYDFDCARYGGMVAREATEEHFCRASELAFDVIRVSRDQSLRLAIALRFMADVAVALERKGGDVATTFAQYSRISQPLFGSEGDAFVRAMGYRAYSEQEFRVRETLAEARHENPSPLLRKWQTEIERRWNQLSRLTLRVPLSNVLLDYLHMLNNRIGLGLSEELYLAFLVARAGERAR